MQAAALILCYGTTDYLRPVIKQYQWLDRILVMNYLFRESDPFPDNTPEICKDMGVECEIGEPGVMQHIVYKRGLEKLKDYEAIFISDADEFIMRADQERLLTKKAEGHNNILVPLHDYADNLFTVFKQRSHCPVVMASPNTNFYDVRNTAGGGVTVRDVYMHHLGFILSPEKVEWKQRKQLKTNGGQFGELCCRAKESIVPPQELLELLKDYENLVSPA